MLTMSIHCRSDIGLLLFPVLPTTLPVLYMAVRTCRCRAEGTVSVTAEGEGRHDLRDAVHAHHIYDLRHATTLRPCFLYLAWRFFC